MNLIELLGSTAFRLALAFAGFFVGAILILFAFIYINTAVFETNRIDQLIATDATILASEPHDVVLRLVTTRVTDDFHRISYAGLFDANGRSIAGNLTRIPPGLVPGDHARSVEIAPFGANHGYVEPVRIVERKLPDGTYLVIGRNTESIQRLKELVLRALALGVVPALAFALAAGAFFSWRTQKRVQEVHETAERIMLGQLRERLPTKRGRDEFDRLGQSVNRMLDQIERLLTELRATGDEIAHDLRTPLTRVRASLERGLESARSWEELETGVERAIVGLDQALTVITAILRIREIEAGRRRSGFGDVNLADIVGAIEELYQPMAEAKGVSFEVMRETTPCIQGDRDLLMEAIGNLVDNAVKFAPPGGAVRVSLSQKENRPLVTVSDTGPGIAEAERGVVFARFYRSENTRKFEGLGLGLSLVAAIANLHAAKISVSDNKPGSVFEVRF